MTYTHTHGQRAAVSIPNNSFQSEHIGQEEAQSYKYSLTYTPSQLPIKPALCALKLINTIRCL